MIKSRQKLTLDKNSNPKTPFGVHMSENILKDGAGQTKIKQKIKYRFRKMTEERPILRLNILAIKKLMNHMKMMFTMEKSKDLLMRITRKNVKLVVYDNKFSEICYLGILDKKFFDIYEFRDIITLRLEEVKVFMKLLKINFRNVSLREG